jgi:FkbM family methyltransferase
MSYVTIGGIEIEHLGCDDYPFVKQIKKEIERLYEFDSIPFEEGDSVIDVGAHVGFVSIYLAKKYGVRVYAYEPVPANFTSLAMNVGANQAEVIPHNLAVSSDGRDMTIYMGNHSGEGGAFVDLTAQQHLNRGSVEVKSTTLEQIFEVNNIETCRLLKLDCEGAEHEIVAGLDGLVEKIEHVRGEIHLNQPLRDMGFTTEETRDAIPGAVWQICEPT